jgi:PAS domain S-box-containing protein
MARNRLKILAIDDNPDNLLSIKALICDAFLDAIVLTATNGKKGIEIARREDPSVILLDILMPEVDGFEICRQIKEDGSLEMIPVVFVTAMETNREMRIKALSTGAEAFLSKPIDEMELIAIIKAMVKIKVANSFHQMEKEQLNQLVEEKTRDLEQELAKRAKAEDELLKANYTLEQNQKALLNLMEDMQMEIQHSKKLETEKVEALSNEKKRTFELEALLEGAKFILHENDFITSARALFDMARKLTGAVSGYVALLSEDGAENELLFLEAGGLSCEVDPYLPMPIRGLRSEAYQHNTVVYDNDFMNSSWVEFMPKGHVNLQNVLFAPLIINGKTNGIIGLANKEGGFNKEDVRIAGAFGDLSALALDHWKSREKLLESEERFRATIMQSQEGIIIADESMKILEWNDAQTKTLGYSKEEMLGKQLWEAQWIGLPEKDRSEEKKAELQQYSLNLMNYIKENPLNYKDYHFTQEFIIQTKAKELKTMEISFYTIMLSNKTYYGAISRDVTEQKHQEKMKDYFISMVSHELRTPMTAIKGSIDMLSHLNLEWPSPDSQQMFLICEKNTDRLCKFVNNVLDFQKLKDSSVSFEISEVNIKNIINDVVDMIEISAREKALEIKLSLQEQLPLVECDNDKIFRLLLNLISNGIKYTEQGSVTIACKLDSDSSSMLISVADTGIGIHEEDIKKLFTSFSQITKSNYSRPGSSGLGLAISKEIVERHGGKIWLESVPNQGSTFYVLLPLKQKAKK